MRVLLADDSPAVRGRLIKMLSFNKDIQIVGEAADSREAIASIRRLQPEVVILDIRMPGGSGIDVLQEIRKDDPAPVVIVLTNYSYPQYRVRCIDAGADFFFDKSKEFDRISDVLTSLIQKPQA